MRGKKAKLIRKLVYGEHGTYRYRVYEFIQTSPFKINHTRFADDKRNMYQTMKGRKAGFPGI